MAGAGIHIDHHDAWPPAAPQLGDATAMRRENVEALAEFNDEAIHSPMTDAEMDEYAAELARQRQIEDDLWALMVGSGVSRAAIDTRIAELLPRVDHAVRMRMALTDREWVKQRSEYMAQQRKQDERLGVTLVPREEIA